MKLLSIIFAVLMSLNVMAQSTCTVIAPHDPELTRGINKDTICKESAYALKERYGSMPATLEIKVTGRATYSVDLFIVFSTDEGLDSHYGVLIWFPGESYVRLH